MIEASSVDASVDAASLLRRSTIAAHDAVERQVRRTLGTLTANRYGRLLARTASLHTVLDDEIGMHIARIDESAIASELGFDARRKMPSLRRDLDALHVPIPAAQTSFGISTLAGAIGALYVCEGATLGGQVIAASVRAALGRDAPLAFYTSYGDDVPRMWATCCRVIDRLLPTNESMQAAVASANATFERFAETLS